MRTGVGLLLVALVAAGCIGEMSASNGPDGQRAAGSVTGAFQKAGNHGMATDTERVTWENTGSRAKGEYSINAGSGSIRLELFDAAGKSVWSSTRSTPGQTASGFTTDEGSSGEWTLVVKLTGYSGQYAIQGAASR